MKIINKISMFLKFSKSKQVPLWMEKLFTNHDLPSMKEMVCNHVDMLNKSEPKYMKTTDLKTLNIVEDILKTNDFLRNNVLNCPGKSVQELASHKVSICDINAHPQILKAHRDWQSAGRGRIVAIGGPSAFDQTLISSLMPEIRDHTDINFYCKSYIESNVWHSANHSHARHGNALNADPILSGRHLLPKILKRMLFNTTVEETLQPNYIKIDVKLNNWRYIKEYAKNQYNGLKQFALWRLGRRNQHDVNRFQSVVSQEIQKALEKQAGMVFTSDHGKSRQNSHSIHLSFNEDSIEEIIDEQNQLKRVKEIRWKEVPQKQLKQLLPRATGIKVAYRYMGDFSNKFDMYEDEKKKCRQLGATWQENKVISKVFLDKDAQGNPFTCGVLFEDGEFVPANKIHLSLGYKVDYQFENSSVRPLTSCNVPAAGVSTTILMRKTPQLKKVIEGEGYLDLAIINSHWTIMAHNQSHVLMRATAGGNTGAQSYMPSYFLNLCSATRYIFGDAFVGVVASYGCVRAINYKNSTQFAKIADGLVISYGKGGTGNTKRASEAYKALKYLGYGKQLVTFFAKHKEDRVNINQGIQQICQQSKQHNLYYDRTRKTAKVLFSQ